MPRFQVDLKCTTTRSIAINAATRTEAVRLAEERAPGFKATEVNDTPVEDRCMACGCALFEGDEYSHDADGEAICSKCYP